jgi:hypothetical protein
MMDAGALAAGQDCPVISPESLHVLSRPCSVTQHTGLCAWPGSTRVVAGGLGPTIVGAGSRADGECNRRHQCLAVISANDNQATEIKIWSTAESDRTVRPEEERSVRAAAAAVARTRAAARAGAR